MAQSLIPNNKESDFSEHRNIKYEYPDGLDLHPDRPLHAKLLQEVNKDASAAYENISRRFPTWKELDEKLTVYVDLTAEEKKIQAESPEKPVAIVVPLNYATRETLLTYWTAAFVQTPIFRYEPSMDPSDALGTLMLESIISAQVTRNKVALSLHTLWSDSFTYGFGAVSPTWIRKTGWRTARKKTTSKILGIPYKESITNERERITTFEGNSLVNLDPYNCLPDPNVPITKVQDMDFFGWAERSNYNNLIKEEVDSDGEYFNTQFLSSLTDKTSVWYSGNSTHTGRYSKTGINTDRSAMMAGKPADITIFYKWIIPEEFGINNSRVPEIYLIEVAADRIIRRFQPLGLDHNMIPVATCSPDADGHSTLPVSILEREYPIQHATDWLWQSHVANVRKSINNMFLIDPSIVNSNDMTDTKFGMLARTRPSAWGRGVKEGLMQIPVQDVTKGHIQDIGFLMGVDNMVFTSSQAKGTQERSGSRVSAQEARDTRMSFLSKMEKGAKLSALQAHYDIAYQFGANTIQMTDEEQYVKIAGEYPQFIAKEYGISGTHYKVSPDALDIRYDVVPNDGTILGGEYADTWIQLMNIGMSHPELVQEIDFTRTWLHVARLMGTKNAHMFLKEPKVQAQEQIDKGVDQGNLVPADQLG